ncbi:MAG: hypothetical protein VST64_01960 [Nitrospirota bacterium]|nr:hypothetical protein [Nitrospirota bacterium]
MGLFRLLVCLFAVLALGTVSANAQIVPPTTECPVVGTSITCTGNLHLREGGDLTVMKEVTQCDRAK